MIKTGIVSYWSFVLVFMCLLQVKVCAEALSNSNLDLKKQLFSQGLTTFLALFSLNKYLDGHHNYSFLSNTIITSSREVMSGLIGIVPLALGWATFLFAVFSSYHRF